MRQVVVRAEMHQASDVSELPQNLAGGGVMSATDIRDTVVDFGTLLEVLGFAADEFVAIGYADTAEAGDRFHVGVGSPADAAAVVGLLPTSADVYFTVCAVRDREPGDGRRGTEADVTRLTGLWCDLDVKDGGCGSLDVARAIIANLSIILGTRPSAIVSSGHGVHGYWVIDDGHVHDGDITAARALARRFGRLVAVVAKPLGAKADNVYDLCHMMRVPETFNNKSLNGQGPLFVVAHADTGGPLTMAEVGERLDAVGIEETDDDRAASREEVSAPADWIFAERTCPYVTSMIDGWATDTPTARNPWFFSSRIRLECAHRAGCVTEADYQRAGEILAARLAELVATTEPRRPLKRFEIPGAEHRAVDVAAAHTDAKVREELGHHPHAGDPFGTGTTPGKSEQASASDGETSATDSGDDDEQQVTTPPSLFDHAGLRARVAADAVMRSVACGFGTVDQRFYVYDHGVWLPNGGAIEAEIARLLGNRYRNSHARNILDMIRYSPATARITDSPLADYINVPNGMLKWKTRELLPHSADYHSTVQLPVAYDEHAQCPRFDKFLADVLPKDCYEATENSAGFIWEVIGYALYSGNPLHIAVLLLGNGRNGKGTLIRVLQRLIGDRNYTTVKLHDLIENRFRAARLFGKLANLAGDLDPRWLDNTATFKAITGGDTVQAEEKYGAAFDFTPWALPVYSVNKPFGSADSSEGWVARWVVVPFPTSFVGREDRGLDARLQTDDELRGILRRGVEALPALMARGRLLEPQSVLDMKAKFVVASDAVRAWLDENCALVPKWFEARTPLHRHYSNQAQLDGAKRLSAREFYNRLEQINGITEHKRDGVRGFLGIRLMTTNYWGAG
jgi:putative DNA primase/helicase